MEGEAEKCSDGWREGRSPVTPGGARKGVEEGVDEWKGAWRILWLLLWALQTRVALDIFLLRSLLLLSYTESACSSFCLLDSSFSISFWPHFFLCPSSRSCAHPKGTIPSLHPGSKNVRHSEGLQEVAAPGL